MPVSYRGSRYQVLETLGEGGTGSVFRARDLVDGNAVALKVFSPGAGGERGEEIIARSEFRILASQTHPGMVRVFDYGLTADGLAYFTMELLDGPDLGAFVRGLGGNPGESPVLLDLVRQLLEALDYIHGRGVLHLDLKPTNVLVIAGEGGRPVVKLIDFGFARGRADAAGGVSGTAEYLAPERIRGEAPDARSDLYSLGVILHEILAGRPPHSGATTAEVLRGHLEGAPAGAGAIPERWRVVVTRLLEPLPSKRFASANAVLSALSIGGGRHVEDLPPFEAAFVGREDLLLELGSAARAAASGTPRAVLLRGPAGGGKTRLLRELAVRLQLEGIPAGVATCPPGPSRPGELLSRLLSRAADGADPRAAAIATEVASLRGTARPGRLDSAESESQRERLFHKAAQAILELAARRPVALLVDNLEHADTLSADALLQLLRALELASDARLLVVLAADADPTDSLDGLERATKGFASFRTLRLGGLGPDEIQRYLAQVFGEGALSSDVTAFLARETGGNVFFLEEYLKLLVRSGRLRRSGSGWELTVGEKLEVPRTVGEAVTRRIARLEAGLRQTLEWASVLEGPVSPEELAAHSGGETTAAEIDRRFAALCLEQLLVREGTRYEFAHTAAKAVAYAGIGEEARRAMHAVAARRLMHEPDRVEEIAHHVYHSGDTRGAREFLRRAGDRARRTGSLREAVLHYSRALEAEDAPLDRFELVMARQEALGLLGRKDAQREDIAALQAIARALGDARLQREASLREALYLESLGRKREALERLEDARTKCAGDPAAEAKLLTRGAMLQFYLSEFDAGFAALSRALEQARGAGDRGLEAECLQVRGLGHYLGSCFDEAVDEMSRALVIRKEEGEEPRAASLESNLGLIHFDRGDLEAAEERFLSSLRLFRRGGLRRGEAVNLLNLGLVYLEMGRYEKALDSFAASVRIRRELGDRRGEGADLGNLGAAWIQLGRHERAVPLLDEALRIARECENRQSESANECRLAQIALDRGETERAKERFERALDVAQKARIASQELPALVGLSRACLALGQSDRAEDLAREALRLAEAGKMRRRPAWIRAVLSAALLEAGKGAEAERTSREAVESLEKHPGAWTEAHFVWFQRHRVLEAVFAEGAGEDALRRAYGLLRERSDAVEDEDLRQSYLENIAVHREINRLHEALQTRNRREASRRERSFHEIAKSLHSITEIDPLLDRLLELAIETTHAEKGLITLKNKGGDFTIRTARGMARESVDDASDICKSVITDVARGGEPVLAIDAGSDERFRERRSIVSFRIRTLMCVPMKVRDEVIGAVYVDGRGASSFNREDLEYLVSFAQLAAIAVENARLLDRLRAENVYLRREVETKYRFENLIGDSPAMDRLTRLMEKVANTPASILVCGETGTGKEVIAKSMHYASNRRSKPFVAVDCGALPENLLESELFGHRRGAFSGAVHDRVGLFEEAEGGTLFLDEITNTSLDLQAKLLRVLQESEIRRVGENLVRKVDVRIIAASNADVRGAVEKGTFREDLYYRLNVIPIEVPALRERPEDIPLLAQHFLERSCKRHGRQLEGFTEEAMRFLSRAPWRGNVRELENLIEKAVILAEEDRIDVNFLEPLMPPSARAEKGGVAGDKTLPTTGLSLSALPGAPHGFADGGALAGLSLEDFDRRWTESERTYLQGLVNEARGNLAEAARRAKVRNRNTLISRLKRHGIRGKRGE